MNGIAVGVALLVSSAGVSPAPVPEPFHAIAAPSAYTFDLSDAAATSRSLSHHLPGDRLRVRSRRGSPQAVPAAPAKRCSRVARILAVAASGFGGWVAGGAIGYVATARPDDDVSGLRGVVIGAPIGAAVGAIIGYRLTK
jgi:hypothetical protein